MKKLIFALAITASMSWNAFAQTETDKVNERFEKIEQQLIQQQNTINTLRSEVENVTKQNLALKKNLKLTPTIANAVVDNEMEYRIIDVTGNKETGEVKITLTAENISPSDKIFALTSVQMVDELGNGYKAEYGSERMTASINGVSEDIIGHKDVRYFPNAPYTINLIVKKYNTEAQFIKALQLRMFYMGPRQEVDFTNLPIKWVSND